MIHVHTYQDDRIHWVMWPCARVRFKYPYASLTFRKYKGRIFFFSWVFNFFGMSPQRQPCWLTFPWVICKNDVKCFGDFAKQHRNHPKSTDLRDDTPPPILLLDNDMSNNQQLCKIKNKSSGCNDNAVVAVTSCLIQNNVIISKPIQTLFQEVIPL